MILSVNGLQALKKKLRIEEGIETKLYKDDRGFMSGGVGHNFDARGIPMPVVELLLQLDIEQTENELSALWPYYKQLSAQRQTACLDVAFNIGAEGFMKFQKMITAIEAGNWSVAALEMLDSDAAKADPSRYRDNANILETNTL